MGKRNPGLARELEGHEASSFAADDLVVKRCVAVTLNNTVIALRRELVTANAKIEKLQSSERRLGDMLPLFQEARDAITAIPLAVAKLRWLDLTLADRMDQIGVAENWKKFDEARPK